jgi:hypothetical protein
MLTEDLDRTAWWVVSRPITRHVGDLAQSALLSLAFRADFVASQLHFWVLSKPPQEVRSCPT